MLAEEGVAEGCHEKGSSLSKHTEVGIYEVCVERIPFFSVACKYLQKCRAEHGEIEQVWGKTMESLKCKAREFGVRR